MKTLQEQYNQIKKGKGSKHIFLKEVKAKYPNLVRNAAGFNEASSALIGRSIIAENLYVGTGNTKKPDWFKVFDDNMNLISEEEAKAIEKKVTKGVTNLQAPDKGYDYKDDKMLNNVSGEQFRQGYFTELTDVANKDKTKEELIDLVIKNIDKNPLYYIEEAQFGIKGIGYTEEAPALGKGKMVKDSGVGGGYGEATKKDFPEGEIGTGYLEIKENKMISLLDLLENSPLGEKPKVKAKKKVRKETTDSKLAEIENNGRIATLELQINALDEIIESKNDRISMVSEDESLSELVDKKKMKEMQREVKLLEKKKASMEKVYEKMCGKSYKKVVTEMDPEAWKRQNGQDADWAPRNEESNANSNENSNDNSNENSNDNKESYSGLKKFRTA
tara:strand:- start:2276 stop:3442 length:1167 start_codon:yes stop_codon:yes gene_type:complete